MTDKTIITLDDDSKGCKTRNAVKQTGEARRSISSGARLGEGEGGATVQQHHQRLFFFSFLKPAQAAQIRREESPASESAGPHN